MFVIVCGLALVSVLEGFAGSMGMRCIKDRVAASFLMVLANLVQRKGMRIKDGLSKMTPAGIVGSSLVCLSYPQTHAHTQPGAHTPIQDIYVPFAKHTSAGNDVVRMGHMLMYLSWFPYACTCLIAGVVTLLMTVGWVSVVALITSAAIAGFNLLMGRLSEKHARDSLKAADKRLGIMSEITQGIKAIKLCGLLSWDQGFGAPASWK